MEKTDFYVKIAWKKAIKHPLKFLRCLNDFLLSHHPFCTHFKGHFITIHGKRFCIGCFFVMIPGFLLGLFIYFTGIWFEIKSFIIDAILFLIILTPIIAMLKLRTKNIKSHICFEVSSKYLLIFIMLYITFEVLYWNYVVFALRVFYAFLVYYVAITLYSAIRNFHHYLICKKCAEFSLYPLCSGLKDIIRRLEAFGFVTIITKSQGKSK